MSWFGGTAQVEHAELSPLANRAVIVWPDADTSGLIAMRKLTPRLPANTQVVRTDGLREKFDAADLEHQGCDDPAVWLIERLMPASEFRSDGPPPDDAAEPSAPNDDAELERLARLPPLDYGRGRKEAAKALGDIPVGILDAAVKAKRAELGLDAEDDGKQGHVISFPEPEPWPEPLDGAKVLHDVAKAIRQYVVMPDHACDTVALWAAHTYLLDHTMITPRLAITSPMKGCGKTTLLDVLGQIVYRPLPAANCSASSIFRVVERHRPCLLIDEADSFLSENEELRGVLNSGHRRGGSVLRTVGDDHEPRAFATYAACAIAMIGQLPGTLADRSVTNDLVRRKGDEAIEPFRFDRVEHLTVLVRKLTRWTRDNAEAIAATEPLMPAGLHNRAADNWRGLLSIATVAGGDWLVRGHKAALAGARPDDAQLELLLGDIRNTCGKQIEVPSADMVDALVALEAHPWAEMGWSSRPLTQNRLARMLKPLRIAPTMIGPETDRKRGYKIADFSDAFDRFLGPAPDSQHAHPKGASQPYICPEYHEIRTTDASQPYSPDPGWTVEECEKPNNDGVLDECTVAKRGTGHNEASGPSIADEEGEPGPSTRWPGLSSRAVDQLACEFSRMKTGSAAELKDAIRVRLAESGVPAEAVDVETGKVARHIETLGAGRVFNVPYPAGRATKPASYEEIGWAIPGSRCDLYGKGIGVKRIKYGGEVSNWHPACAENYLKKLADPPVKIPEQPPDT
jgi:putative DNA primase/helicase